MKIIFATHSTLAMGFKNTLDFFTESKLSIFAINAYVTDNETITNEVQHFIRDFSSKEKLVFLTDISYGSVNQAIFPYISDRIHLVSGVNFPLALSIALQLNDDFTSYDLNLLVEEARNQIVYLNVMANKVVNTNDE